MECKLKDNFDHKLMPEKYRNYFFHCPLFENKGLMSSTGICCANCCIRISQVIQALDDMLLRSVFTKKELQQNPKIFYPYLPVKIKDYAEIVPQITDKDWLEIKFICGRCTNEPLEKVPTRPTEAQEMTCLKRHDFT